MAKKNNKSKKNIQNLYELARREKSYKEWAAAARYYQEILCENPKDWEATFYVGVSDVTSRSLAELKFAMKTLSSIFSDALKLIDKNNTETAEVAIRDMSETIIAILGDIHILAMNHYSKFIDLPSSAVEYYSNRLTLSSCAFSCGFDIHHNSENKELSKLCVDLLVYSVKLKVDALTERPVSEWKTSSSSLDPAVDIIQVYCPDYKNPIEETLKRHNLYQGNSSSGGCYIATAVYGSYDCSEVWTLRRFRDNDLAKTWFGRCFIRVYYAISPTLVKIFGNKKWFKATWKTFLDRMVVILNEKGVENTPYEDRIW